MNLRNLLIATLGLAAIVGAAGEASATTHYYWHNGHRYVSTGAKRRVQVNQHISAANRKIQWAHRTGQINAYQAQALYARTKHTRILTKSAAANQGGRLTPAQQAALDHKATVAGAHAN